MSVHSNGPKSRPEKELPRTLGGTNQYHPDAVTAAGWSRPPVLRDEPSDYAPLVQPGSTEMPRTDPGRYQLLGEIARGGMGVVLKGRDPDLGRDLAVKVLRSELVGNATAEQRFVEEAQVGGQLQHPGVVPVYEIGRFADGRPFFTMKLVKGRTLSAHLSERASPTHERGRFLKIFDDVAQTIAYTHSKGVIHRDLKPANIMVGNFGEVLVMDWGLAKVLTQGGIDDEKKEASRAAPPRVVEEKTVIRTVRSGSDFGSDTEAGSMLGTPAYMPPEQAGGELDRLDERADVFGLGAILCVILTGEPPYVAETGEKVRLMAVRGNLTDAYARLDACTADAELKALCRKCLAAEPQDRPRNAGEVAALIHDHLVQVEERAHQAEVQRVKAETETRGERSRRKLLTTLGGAIVATLLAGAALAGWQWKRTEAERNKTAAALDKAKEEQTRTFAALNAMSDEGVERMMTSQIEIGEEQKAFVKKVIALYDEATRSQLDTPEGRAAMAHGYFSVGKLRDQIEDFPAAIESQKAAIALYEPLVKDDPTNRQYRYGLAMAEMYEFRALNSLHRNQEATAHVQSAMEYFKALVAEEGGNDEYQYGLARSHINLGINLSRLNPSNRDVLLALNREGVAQFQRLIDRNPESKVYTMAWLTAMNNLAHLYDNQSKEKEDLHRRAIQIGQKALERAPSDALLLARVALIRSNYGAQLLVLKRYSESEAETRAAKMIRTQLVQRFPVIRAYARDLALTTYNLASILKAQNKSSEAYSEYLASANFNESLINVGEKHSEIIEQFCFSTFMAYELSGRIGSGEMLARAISMQRELAKNSRGSQKSSTILANLIATRGRLLAIDRPIEAVKSLTEAIAICDELLSKPPITPGLYQIRAIARNSMGVAYHNMDKPAEALREYRASIADHKIVLDQIPNDEYTLNGLLNAYQNTAVILREQKQYKDGLTEDQNARKLLLRLIELAPNNEQRQRLFVIDSTIGYSLSWLGRSEEAETVLNAALASARSLMKEPSPSLTLQRYYVLAVYELGRIKSNRKKYDEAEPLLREVNDLFAKLAPMIRDSSFTMARASHAGMMAAIKARKGDYATASKAIPTILAINPDEPSNYFNVTCLLGHCVTAVGKDRTISEQVRKDLTAGYHEQAFGYLRQGIAKGFRDVEATETDADLEPIRKHPEFAKILDEMRKAPPVAPKPDK